MAKRQKKSKPDNRLNYGEVSRELKSGGPARLYLLYGREDYLREAFLGELKALCLPEGEDDFSYHRLDGKNLDMRELSDAVNALPFLTERTLTEVRGYDFARCRDAEAASLERLISDIPDCCTLVFVQDTDFEPDQRTKIIKAVAKYGKLIDFTSQGQGPLVQWIRKRFAALGKNATPDACLTLIYLSGELMNGLIPEIEKIAAGTAGELVTAEDVSRLALRIPEARVFEMTDYLAARDYDGAARTLADLMSMGEEPIAILAVIGMQMRRLYAARVALDEKLGSDFVRENCGAGARSPPLCRNGLCHEERRRRRGAADAAADTPRGGGGRMISVKEVIVVEGRYDRNTLSQVFDAVIVETSGFGVFNDREKLALLRRLAEARGLVVLTDSDGAGFVIRNFLKGAIDPALVKQAYIPDIAGRERRKRAPSKEGKLGVEGMKPEVLIEALRRAGATLGGEEPARRAGGITKATLYELGLSGGPGSAEKRRALLKELDLPEKLSANALLDVLNALYTEAELREITGSVPQL